MAQKTAEQRVPLLSRYGVIFSVASALLATFVMQIPVFRNLEYRLYDEGFRTRGPLPVSGNTIIVAVDDQTFGDLQAPYPYSRGIYAKLVRNLSRARARLIVFDIEFLAPNERDRKGDKEFAKAIAEAGNVILAGKVALPKDRRVKGIVAIPPAREFRDVCLDWGATGISEDDDGFTRRYPICITDEIRNVKYYSLGLTAVAAMMGYDLNRDFRELPDKCYLGEALTISKFDPGGSFRSSTFLINFHGPARTFKTYSMSSVLDDADFDLRGNDGMSDTDWFDFAGEKVFKDKIVLIGNTMEEEHDIRATPFYKLGEGERSRTPGVEVHANAIETMLEGRYIKKPGHGSPFFIPALLFVFALLTTMAVSKKTKQPHLGALIAAGIAGAYLVLVLLLFVRAQIWLEGIGPVLAISFAFVTNTSHAFLREQKDKRMIKNMFQHYLPRPVMIELFKNPDLLNLGGEERELTVLFSDVQGFTSFSEGLSPQELVSELNQYLSLMTDAVGKYGGILDKYEGDAVMAEFGAPLPDEQHALKACQCALEMQKAIEELGERRIGGKSFVFRTRIGINTGLVVIGNIGSREVFDYTVIGDTVNLASRLEQANKHFGTLIMISESTYEKVKQEMTARELDLIRVKGRTTPVKVYELIARSSDGLPQEKKALLEKYAEGLKLYANREFKQAKERFEEALAISPEDRPSEVYRDRCMNYIESPPPEDWDGVFTFKTKG